MEISNDLTKYIITFQNVIPEQITSSFFKFCKSLNYTKAKVIGSSHETVNENIRKVLHYGINDINAKSLTQIHWRNFLSFTFQSFVNDYQKMLKITDPFLVNDIQILKYENTGHYKAHTDDSPKIHRRVSCIYFVNEEYEGGDLVFSFLHTDKKLIIKPKKNNLIIWPSNFMYPHSVEPVTKGERYSVVAWGL